ncbi:MAG: hypothetical protein IKU46_10385 [Peptococcaceae bacterium]|nr:hypothetical protein [Peptococcaceae bacterium]
MKKYVFLLITIALTSVFILVHTANANMELRPAAIKYALFVSVVIWVFVVAGLMKKIFFK